MSTAVERITEVVNAANIPRLRESEAGVVLLALLAHRAPDGTCTPTIATLAEYTNLQSCRIVRARDVLRRAGIIDWVTTTYPARCYYEIKANLAWPTATPRTAGALYFSMIADGLRFERRLDTLVVHGPHSVRRKYDAYIERLMPELDAVIGEWETTTPCLTAIVHLAQRMLNPHGGGSNGSHQNQR
jgi:hypothetical protein